MAVSYLSISAVCTVLSFVGLQYWTGLSLEKLTSGVISEDSIEPGNAHHVLRLASSSQATIALLANFVLNVFLLLILSVKGIFLPMIVSPTIFQVGLWSTWLTILCSLKMFQALARDRLERLNASPSATPFTYYRVYSVLLLVLSVDLFWIKLCLVIYRTLGSSMFLLLFFEPLSIAFETLQAIVVHGFQLLDMWLHHSAGTNTNCQLSKLFDMSAGSLWEWKGILVWNLGFFLDIMTLLMALGHYVLIWWLHGMAFHLVDAVLFLNIRALLSAIAKRIKGFIRLRTALGTLHGALPDATSEEIKAYDDECAICREPMVKAKRLSCNHLFHLACLKSWLDQGLNENYSCPTCRKPFRVGRAGDEANPRTVDVSTDGQLARQITSGLDRQHNSSGHTLPTGMLPNQMQNPLESVTWRGPGLDPSLLQTWSGQGLDGAGPSTGIGSARLGRVQMMMRHLAAVGETYAQTALEDGSWSPWPLNPSQAGTSTSPLPPPPGSLRYPGSTGGLRMRTPSRASNDNIPNMLAMAETVREVLPHIPDEIIFQDLQRTNSATVTVNNLLHM